MYDITGLVAVAILLMPVLIGWIKGEVYWNGHEFTMKKEKSAPARADKNNKLNKFNNTFILTHEGQNFNKEDYSA